MRCFTASVSAGLVGPRLEPFEPVPLFGCGVVADGRPQKYFGSVNDWPISAEPIGLPSLHDQAAVGLPRKDQLRQPVATSG
jgi:hypothetical protein